MSRNDVLNSMKHNNPAGASMVEISEEELTRVYGGGDVQGETTAPCFYVGYGAYVSSANCAWGAGSVVGLGLSIWKC